MIDKPGKGSFYGTDLQDDPGPQAGITTLIVTGVTTEVCVHTTVREANDRGYEVLGARRTASAPTSRSSSASAWRWSPPRAASSAGSADSAALLAALRQPATSAA